MMDFLFKICSAITVSEGFYTPGSIAQRNNNPGNLRSAPWLKTYSLSDGFWKATSLQEGIAGLYHQIALDVSRGSSLKQLIYKYAPPSDHNATDKYIVGVAKLVGINNIDEPLWNYLELVHLK